MVVLSPAGKTPGAPLVLYGDIAVPTGLQNADPCTGRSCLWPKARDGNVYIPYRISQEYCESKTNDSKTTTTQRNVTKTHAHSYRGQTVTVENQRERKTNYNFMSLRLNIPQKTKAMFKKNMNFGDLIHFKE